VTVSFLSFSIIFMRYIPELNDVLELMSRHSIDVMPFNDKKLPAGPKSAVRVIASSSRSTIAGNLKVHGDGFFVF